MGNDKSYVIVKLEHFEKQHNTTSLIMHSIEVTSKAIKSSKNGKVFIIVDLFNLKSKNIKLNFITLYIKVFKEMYQDILEKCIIINTTPFFNSIFNIIKTFIDKVTLDKIEIRKLNYNKIII